ncbi:MAG: RluA family pseudouridine synthase [Alphaproteobacteria bacterium]|nr:MAG: RluA family pseudouridine synthase [Alphaproteobacteria bacterium]
MTTCEPEHRHLVTARPDDGGRLDAFLARRIKALSRSRLKALITGGTVSADGETILDPSRAVKPGTAYAVTVPAAVPAEPRGQDIPLTILFEDEDLIVVDKPAGLVVHPAPGNPEGTLVNALIYHCGASLSGIGGVKRPGIVHRLDKDTSGVMVAAKTDRAHDGLVTQFQARTVERAYGALVWGVPQPAAGRITGNIGRSPRNRKKMAVVARGGRPAATNYKVIRAFSSAAELECRLESGRTHQIRVHLAHIGHAVIGDPVYGGRGRGTREARLGGVAHQALHAHLLGFLHPISAEKMKFEAPFPLYFNALLKKLEEI